MIDVVFVFGGGNACMVGGVASHLQCTVVMTCHHQYKTSHLTMLIKMIFEVDPLICPECEGEMKIISIFDRHQKDVLKKILKHCDLWNDSSPPLIRNLFEAETEFVEEVTIDLDYFDMNV